MTDACAGIPIPVPGGAWPDLDASHARMGEKGTLLTTTDDVRRSLLTGRPVSTLSPAPLPGA